MNGKPSSAPEAPCIRCGEMTSERLGGRPICRACYDIRSSCCQEFGGDDLTAPWEQDEPVPEHPRQNG